MKQGSIQEKRCADALERIADVLEAGQKYFTKADEDLKKMGYPAVFDEASDAARDPTMEPCPNCGEVKVWERHDIEHEPSDWYECKACHYTFGNDGAL